MFRIFDRERERAMPAHRMTGDRLPPAIHGKIVSHGRCEIADDIALHREMRRPRLLRRIDVKAGTLPQIVGLVIRDT